MDALLTYLLERTRIKDRIFVSNPPGPAVLVWSDFSAEKVITGITMVHRKNFDCEIGLDFNLVLQILRARLSHLIPILDITYCNSLELFEINGETLSNADAAKLISESFKVKLSRIRAKKANDPSQINDPFHIWSRELFDGISVRKIDIDAILINEQGDDFKALIEIKRSAKVKVGKWLPYIDPGASNTDYWNYIIAFSLSKMLTCNFLTFHHEILGLSVADDTELDLFEFNSRTIISAETVRYFGSDFNRRILKAKVFI